MKLMRKVRKRVLGDVSVPVAADGALSDNDKSPTSLDAIQEDPRFSLVNPSRHSISPKPSLLRRSVTLGPSSGAVPASAVHRAHSLTSLQPLSVVSPSRHSQVSPIVFAWPDGTFSEANSALSSALPSPAHSACGPDSTYSVTSVPAAEDGNRSHSPASSVPVTEESVEQLQRTRAAKPTRSLGDTIPEDVLLRASSPAPRASSPMLSTLRKSSPAPDGRSGKLLRRTESVRPLKNGDKKQKRLSLDLRAFAALVPPAPSSSSAEPARTNRTAKTRSVWMPKRALYEENEGGASSSLSLDVVNKEIPRVGMSMNDRQHAMAVRRARKIEQLLGDTPPSALFHITNISPGPVAEEDSASLSSGCSTKRNTVDSIASSLISYLADNASKPESSILAPLDTSPTRSADRELQPQPLPSPDSLQPSPATDDEPIESPTTAHPNHPGPDIQYRSLPSTASLPQSFLSQTPLGPLLRPELVPLPPRTPPPFSNLDPPPAPEPVEPPRAPSPPSGPEFRARRMRAAKLSRFFGVAPGDLADALPPLHGSMMVPSTPTAPSRPRTPASHYRSSADSPPQSPRPLPPLPAPASASAEVRRHTRAPSTTVEVAAEVAGKSPFRFFDGRVNNVVKDVDMRDVIDQLRRMR